MKQNCVFRKVSRLVLSDKTSLKTLTWHRIIPSFRNQDTRHACGNLSSIQWPLQNPSRTVVHDTRLHLLLGLVQIQLQK